MKIKMWLMAAALTVTAFFSLHAQTQDYDVVVFKSDAELPDYAKDRQLKCVVTDSGDSEVTVDISQYQGIQTLKKIPRSLISDITLFDRAKAGYNKIKEQIKLPANSAPAEYYDEIIRVAIQPLLYKYPDSEAAPQLTAAAQELKREQKLVQLGWARRGTVWFSPDETKGYASQWDLPRFLSELKTIQQEVLQGQSGSLVGLAERVSRYKNSLHYPYLLEGMQVIIRPAKGNVPPELLLLTKQNSMKLLDLSKQFLKTGDRFEQIREQQLEGLELYVPLLEAWITVSKSWPELEGLQNQVTLGLDAVLNNLWLSALQDKADGVFDRVTFQTRELLDCGALPMAKVQAVRAELDGIAKFKEQLRQLQNQNQIQAIAELLAPERVAAFAPARELFQSLTGDAKAKMEDAGQLLADSQRAYQAGEWDKAAEKITAANKLWPDNPGALAYYNQLAADFSAAIAKRKKNREQIGHILAVLRSGWPKSEQVSQFEQDLNYKEDFLDRFDNFSLVLVGVITFCVIAGYFALKYLGRLFSEG